MKLKIKVLNNNYDINTSKIEDFYKKHPFPGYSPIDNKFSILKKGDTNLYFKKLKSLFKNKKKILEIGSGTCQLANYFAIGTNNEVFAFDATYDSLLEGKKFAEKNNISNINFIKGNLLEKNFKDNYFDLVICNGVLHHTSNPYLGFKNSLKCLNVGGVIVLGLYNRYGRLTTNILRLLYKIFGSKIISFIDPVCRKMKNNYTQQIAWIEDQYNHPLEKSYSFKEINKWFDENNIQLISTIPNATKKEFSKLTNKDLLKRKNYKLNKFHILKEIEMIFNKFGEDGGLFIFLGVKQNDSL